MSEDAKFDWGGFVVRFVFGAVLGVFFAFGILSARSLQRFLIEDESRLWALVVLIALGFGFLSAIFGDAFWKLFTGGDHR